MANYLTHPLVEGHIGPGPACIVIAWLEQPAPLGAHAGPPPAVNTCVDSETVAFPKTTAATTTITIDWILDFIFSSFGNSRFGTGPF